MHTPITILICVFHFVFALIINVQYYFVVLFWWKENFFFHLTYNGDRNPFNAKYLDYYYYISYIFCYYSIQSTWKGCLLIVWYIYKLLLLTLFIDLKSSLKLSIIGRSVYRIHISYPFTLCILYIVLIPFR